MSVIRRPDRYTDTVPVDCEIQTAAASVDAEMPAAALDHPALLPPLAHRRVHQPWRWTATGPWAGPASGPGRGDRPAVGPQDRRLVGRVLVAGHQVHHPARRSAAGSPRRAPRCSRRSAPPARRRRPAGAPGRRPRGPSSPPCGRRPGRSRSQFASFLATKAHFSSNWASRVRGGNGDQFVVEPPGVLAGDPAVAGDGVAVHLAEPAGLADAAALGDVLQDRLDLLGGSRAPNRGVPLRSEKRALQVRQRSMRRDFSGP